MAYNIETIYNQNGAKAVLLRHAKRDGKKIRKKTILKGGVAISNVDDRINIQRSLPHGHVLAALGTARNLGLEKILYPTSNRQRSLALAAVITRLLAPASKIAIAHRLSEATATSSIGSLLKLGNVSKAEMHNTLDWLLKRQPHIEKALSQRHLNADTLFLYDFSSSGLESYMNPSVFSINKLEKRKSKQQLLLALLCTAEGCPVAVKVFVNNTGEPDTMITQINNVLTRYDIKNIALMVGRGMVTSARMKADIKPATINLLSVLKTTSLRKMVGKQPKRATSLIPDDMIPDTVLEVTSPDFPGERLMVCNNPRLQEEHKQDRKAFLQSTEYTLATIERSVVAGTLRGADKIVHRLELEVNRRKVEKYFFIAITDSTFTWERRQQKIDNESQMDGIYAIRTNLTSTDTTDENSSAFQSLANAERTFRTIKSDVPFKQFNVKTNKHVRGYVFLCMLAYYIEWHMRHKLAPILFQDDKFMDAQEEMVRSDVSLSAQKKTASKRIEEGVPFHSFQTLLDDLSLIVLHAVQLSNNEECKSMTTQPTELQSRAFQLLDVSLN
ncbi:MAG: hypothetical protein OXC02_02890 [Rhodobacteraceae bacterium]|nr:hypothetical protein [Paracoccaceae bacterium]